MQKRTCLILTVIAIAGLTVFAGCGGSNNPRLATSEFAGKWIEQPGERPPSFKDKDLKREMELTDSGTFKITIVDMSGKPVSPPRTVEGTFRLKGPSMYFTVTNDQFGAGEMDAPMQSILIQLKARGHGQDLIETRDTKGGRTKYVRE